jgi:D-inositol-3-phosphate glycosyltransferase
VEVAPLRIAMLSVHSCPVGELGTHDTGGMSVYVRELARELGRRGHLVDIYTRLHGPWCNEVVELGTNVRLVHLGAGDEDATHRAALFPYLVDFFRELEQYRGKEGLRYDLIHSNYWLSGRVGQWARARWRVPHLLMFHTLGAVKNALFHRQVEPELRITTEGHLADRCDRLLAASEREKEQLIRFCGVQSEAVGVIPCGVDLDRFRPVDKTEARDQIGLHSDEPVVLYVGRFAPLKGVDRLLEAVACLRHGWGLIRLVIVGGDGEQTPASQELKRLSRRFGIADRVTFAGRVDQESLPYYYSAADVVALPSHYESFGLVALESLACGTPVVTTPVGAMESIIRQGETGCVVHDASPPILATAIEGFLPRAKAVSVDAIRSSTLDWSWSGVASAMMVEYSLLLEKKWPEHTGDPPLGVPDVHTNPLIHRKLSLPAGKPGGTR